MFGIARKWVKGDVVQRDWHQEMLLQEKLQNQQTEIEALKDELDTLDITLRAESKRLLATTAHLYRVQRLTWWQRVSLAIFQPESLWRIK